MTAAEREALARAERAEGHVAVLQAALASAEADVRRHWATVVAADALAEAVRAGLASSYATAPFDPVVATGQICRAIEAYDAARGSR